ncbi:hypothetical protein J3R82DRAFT_1349 [Butyriboletus roseoflavus]|nr:hypothetical protein J3R82DRAFT_1349 [Butyriboletus roseoflavus]
MFCYPGPHEICLMLTHGQISYWACEIISGIGTVDNKPPILYLHATRPCTQTQPSMAAGSDHPLALHLFSPLGRYLYPPAPPVIVVPPWGGSLQGPGYPPHGALLHGYLYSPTAQPANILQVIAHSSTSGPNSSHSTSPTFSNATDTMSLFLIYDVPLARIPSIFTWLMIMRSRAKTTLASLNLLIFLNKKVFFASLSCQGMLNVLCGIALLIMLYAKQDLQKLVLKVL